jgi:hypothetical protein
MAVEPSMAVWFVTLCALVCIITSEDFIASILKADRYWSPLGNLV